MVAAHRPVPMSSATLRHYRWVTPLPIGGATFATINALGTDLPGLPSISAALAMVIGETDEPHTFANAAGTHRPAIRQKVWGYGQRGQPVTYPGPMILSQRGKSLDVTFTNRLPSATFTAKTTTGKFGLPGMRDGDYPFIEPMADLAAGAMGAGGMGRYSAGHAVVHLHGADLPWENDGFPMRLPKGAANPRGLRTVLKPGESVTLHYPNNQRGGGLLWYHDHTMDSTARNVYAGLAGAYPLLAPKELEAMDKGELPSGPYHVPLIIQDRSFTESGKLLYGDAQFLGDYHRIAKAAKTRDDIRHWLDNGKGNANAPMSEFKGQALLVNGKVWPTLDVEPRPYRFRILNGCNSRFMVLRLSREKLPAETESYKKVGDSSPDAAAATLYQIGSDGGMFSRCVPLTGNGPPSPKSYLVLAPGERADIIVDFSELKGTRQERTNVFLTNHSTSQSPLGISGDDLDRFGDASLLGNVLRFQVADSLETAASSPTSIAFKDPNADPKSSQPTDFWDAPTARAKGVYPSDPVLMSIDPKYTWINQILEQVTDEEDKVFGLPLPGIVRRYDAQVDKQVRQYVIRENADIAQSAEDADYTSGAPPGGTASKWPPGRRGWSAITFQSDITRAGQPGFLWGGSMDGKSSSHQAPLPPQWSPPLMGGPALDGTLDFHSLAPHVELWEIYNLSGDIHPIHLHLVNFCLLERQRLRNGPDGDVTDVTDLSPDDVLWSPVTVELNECSGWKDTARVNPGELTRLLVQFRGNGGSDSVEGNFVWHCHLLEHEDMGMMRPLNVYS